MTFTDQSFKDGWSDAILVKLILLISISLNLFTLYDYFLSDLLLRVFTALKTDNKLCYLAGDVIGCSVRRGEPFFCIGHVVVREFGQVEEALHHRVHVACVAQIFHACKSWSKDWDKLFASFKHL